MVPPRAKLKDFRRPEVNSLATRKVTLVCVKGVQGAALGFSRRYSWLDWRTMTVKTVLITALGATLLASAGAAAAGDRHHRHPAPAPYAGSYGAPVRYDANCACNVPVVTMPFYTVRPPQPTIYVRAPGIRVSAPPVYAPAPTIHVQSPTIYVDAPPVHVAAPQVYLEAPAVHVRPSDVTVAPPEVHFTPAVPRDDACCQVAPRPAPAPAHNYRQEPGERG